MDEYRPAPPLFPNEAYAFSELLEQFDGPAFALDADPRDIRIADLEESLGVVADRADAIRRDVRRVVTMIGALLFLAGAIFGGLVSAL